MTAADVPSFALNNGSTVPSIGMGCWMGSPGGGERVKEMCDKALTVGYRHFDTASGYANEAKVGLAIAESGIPREQLYVTTKLWNGDHHRVREAFEESLAKLNCDYIDLYLMHWPQAVSAQGVTLQADEYPTIIDTWKEMEKLVDTGKVKSIGVSNFSIKTLTRLLPHCRIFPATNQVELHPYLPQTKLKAFCEERGILLTAYSPIGSPYASSGGLDTTVPTLVADPTVQAIADKHGATPAQALINWAVQRNTIVIPKSENLDRMTANITLVKLDDADMQALNVLHERPGMHRSLLSSYHDNNGSVFGWTYEQLGWDMKLGGIVAEQSRSLL
ncbi:hypothetical protein HETIRDRAFT_461341 [Heterobasidion irregulare TC 32-1]|uniref:NADP-dependent oxidoreductase domain-containing protein n=1 Tax=Heterobasidion irregulare (strain TC 32-1) TaxID=747525 RepID=W4JPL1_HETIT|nr:uncharacterized protein HETIRDRAFT_461341 [Heterobasidion irregulare TC 32-1]ETW75512.1 hypothetical protein HETIRDRAFT_461341 [Heterobasidion irregulare TC 32-1]